jgi:hypothetical protein
LKADLIHIILQSRNTQQTEFDVQANGQVIGQIRMVDGEWRSLVPTAIPHGNMHDGVNLLLQQWAVQFN